MAALDFPTSPTNGQQYTAAGHAWIYNTAATSWVSSSNAAVRSIGYVIDGGAAVPATGVWGQISIPIACTITGWILTGDASGSCVVDVLRSTYSAFPTTTSIAGTDKPTLSTAQKNQNLAISAWGSVALAAGDQVQFNLNSVTTIKRIAITLMVTIP